MVMAVSVNDTSTEPAFLQMTPSEDLTIGLDFAARLGVGVTVSSIIATLKRVDTNAVITLPTPQPAPNLTGSIASVRVAGLTLDVVYWLEVVGTLSNGNKQALTLYIECVR
jgi:hypothetical protein